MILGMRLSEWARPAGVHYQTAWKWFRQGTLPVRVRQTATGTILVDEPRRQEAAGVALYARVSSSDQREDLDRQVGFLAAWATAQGLGVTATRHRRERWLRTAALGGSRTTSGWPWSRSAWIGVRRARM